MYDKWHVSAVQKDLPISPPTALEGRSSYDAGRTSRAKNPHSFLLPDRSRGQKLIHTGLTLLYYRTCDKSIEYPLHLINILRHLPLTISNTITLYGLNRSTIFCCQTCHGLTVLFRKLISREILYAILIYFIRSVIITLI